MERYIVKNSNLNITISKVENHIIDEGIIIIYEEGEVIGHVKYEDYPKKQWLLELISDRDIYDSLEEILDAYPNYSFKYIT